jgi:hypothetical protein
VTVPSFLFTIGIATGVIRALLALLRLLTFLALQEGLKHGQHISHALVVAPKLLVGLLPIPGGLTCACTGGLAVLVLATAIVGIVGLVRPTVSLAPLAKLLGTGLLRDSLGAAP